MRIKKVGKLHVTRETLRNLNDESLDAAAGGFGSLTSGTVQGGGCCAGCGCIRTEIVCGGGTQGCVPDQRD